VDLWSGGWFFYQESEGGRLKSYAVVPATNRVVQEFCGDAVVIANAAGG